MTDPAQWLAFCTRLVNNVAQNPGFLYQLVVSDEAIFSLNLEVNTHNVIHDTPHGQRHPANHFVEFEIGANSAIVWIGLTRAGVVLGPHFIQGNLNTREYLRIIRYRETFPGITSTNRLFGGSKIERQLTRVTIRFSI